MFRLDRCSEIFLDFATEIWFDICPTLVNVVFTVSRFSLWPGRIFHIR